MDSTIYYFSATGNSLRIAKIIAKVQEANLLSMPICKGTTCKSEVIGFVFPIYFWGIPKTVADFISELHVKAAHPYIFAVTTYGALHGGALGYLEKQLKRQGLHLDYGINIESIANFIEEYNPKTNSCKEKLEIADSRAEKAAEDIIAKKKNGPYKYSVWDKLFYKIYTDIKLNRDKGFHVNDNCTHCGICQSICPNNNIISEGGLIKFQHQCEHCVACINCCPQSAIQWRNVTQKRNRYKNPEISIKEIVTGMQKE